MKKIFDIPETAFAGIEEESGNSELEFMPSQSSKKIQSNLSDFRESFVQEDVSNNLSPCLKPNQVTFIEITDEDPYSEGSVMPSLKKEDYPEL